MGVITKSSVMLGLGETDDEVIDTMYDLRDVGVELLTFGQYLQVPYFSLHMSIMVQCFEIAHHLGSY